jgi:tetratricopeptide (TPR) repeat protein
MGMGKSKGKVKAKGGKVAKRPTARPTPSQVLNALALKVRKNPADIASTLDLAAFYCFHEQESRVLETLRSITPETLFADGAQEAEYRILLALGYAHVNQLIDAESAAQDAADRAPDSPDPWYVLAFVHLSMREYDEAIETGTKYLTALASSQPAAPIRSYCQSAAHQSQLYNILATACKESGRVDEAIDHYRKSIGLDGGNHLPYLNLIALLRKLGRHAEATETCARGLKAARQVQELRILQTATGARSGVSACMIVKNEEEMLPDCLASVRDWVDEIIVVDTGSTDRTVEIAQSYGAKVFHQPWEGDFSKARNFSLSHATAEWIFIIDADERVTAEDVPQLRRVLDDQRVQLVSINVYNVYGDSASAVTFLPSIRLFRRSLGLRYEGTVHNMLVYSDSMPVARVGVRLKHLGYGLSKEKMVKKLARSRVLLEQQLKDNPDNAFALFNYAQLLRGEPSTSPAHNAELILKSARRAVELTRPDIPSERHIHLMCLDQMAWTCFHQGRFAQALEYARRALGHKSNYLDPLLLLGHVAARREAYDEARTFYEDYLRAQAAYDPSQETDNIILLHVDSRPLAWYSLGAIAELQNDPDQAQHYYELIIKRDPGYLDANNHLGRLAAQRHDLVAAERWYLKQLEFHPESLEACRQLGQIYLSLNRASDAERLFAQGLAIEPADSVCLVGLGRSQTASGRATEAIATFEEAVRTGSAGLSIRRELAATYFKSGRYVEAAALFEDLANNSPTDGDLLNDLGNCYFKMEQYDRAGKNYRRALETPTPPAIVWRNLGLSQTRSGDNDAAAISLQRYVELEPEALDIVRVLADLYFLQGRYESALDYLEKCLHLRPGDSSAMFQLSECYLLMGHKDSAILGYRRALQLDPACQPALDRLTQLVEVPAGV